MTFTHLHTYSEYSLLEGVAPPATLVARAQELAMPALALTDHASLYGAIPFYQAARAAGLQPILGLEVDTDHDDRLVLLAESPAGYRSLCRIASAIGRLRRPGQPPARCPLSVLQAERAGLIALAGGSQGHLARLLRAGHRERASALLGAYRAIFGETHLYVELALHAPDDAPLVAVLHQLAGVLGLPVTATNEVVCAHPGEADTAHLLDAIRLGTTLAAPHPGKRAATTRYLKSADEMATLFADWPEALDQTRAIARRCDLELPLGRVRYPRVALPREETAYSRLWKLAFAGATQRYRPLVPAALARLQREIDVITQLGYADYFLIVHDIVQWARRQGIPILARGSAVDSIVSYCLGLSQIDPLEYDLYAERFLHAGRPDPPDIDLDIDWRARHRVLAYVYERYGADHVAMVSTHVRFGAGLAWRDVARAHGVPAEALRNAPTWPRLEGEDAEAACAVELSEADSAWGPLYPCLAETGIEEPPADSPGALTAALQADCAAIEGHIRHLGIHCGGMLVTEQPLTDDVPLVRATNGLAITGYEMEAIKALGLLKIDLLGNRALSVLRAVCARARQLGIALDLDTIPRDDRATFLLIAAGDTLGCYQLESPGMRALLRTLRPRTLDDIIIAISLFRPGPIQGGLKDLFLSWFHLGGQPAYWHPRMAGILGETHGVILFQEQVLQLLHELAGFTLAEAEQIRKQLGSTLTPPARADLEARFLAGTAAHGIDADLAGRIWSALVAFSGFGFNKGHACAFGLLAYQMAYCKAHFPELFLAALLEEEAGFYPPQVYIEEGRRLGVRLEAPDLNHSGPGIAAQGRGLRFGLDSVNGLRAETVAALIRGREEGGAYQSVADLLGRVALAEREIEALIQVGALDRLAGGRTRAELLWQAQIWRATHSQRKRGGEPGLPLEAAAGELEALIPRQRQHTRSEILELERKWLGFTLSGHPLEPYAPLLERHGTIPAGALAGYARQRVLAAGLPVVARRHWTKAGQWMLFVTLLDLSGMVEVVVMPDKYQAVLPSLAAGGPVFVDGTVENPAHGGAVLRADEVRLVR